MWPRASPSEETLISKSYRLHGCPPDWCQNRIQWLEGSWNKTEQCRPFNQKAAASSRTKHTATTTHLRYFKTKDLNWTLPSTTLSKCSNDGQSPSRKITWTQTLIISPCPECGCPPRRRLTATGSPRKDKARICPSYYRLFRAAGMVGTMTSLTEILIGIWR